MAIPLVIFFIICMLFLVFSLFYLFDGLFFNGISLAILGVLLFIYLMLEFVYNILFNRNHPVNRIFILFILSISLIGSGLGLSFASLSNFDFYENMDKEVNTHIIDMSDDLVITSMMYDMGRNDIIIDNSLNDIKLEIISYGQSDAYLYNYNSLGGNDRVFKVYEVDYDYNEMGLYKEIFDNLKDNKIVNYDRLYEVKMYVSYDNLIKLRENINKYTGNIWFE